MSRRKPGQSELTSFFESKSKGAKDDNKNDTSEPSNEKHHISFDLEIERTNANEINWAIFFELDFNFADTSSNQIDDECGEIASSSKLNVHIEGTAQRSDRSDGQRYNVEE